MALGGILVVTLLIAGWGCGGRPSTAPERPQGAGASTTATTAAVRAADEEAQLLAEFQRAAAMLETYDYAGASEAFAKVVAARPDWTAARFNLALSLLNRNTEPAEQDRAVPELRRILEKEPNNPWAQFALGVYAQSRGQGAEALTHFEAVHKADPTDLVVAYKYAGALQAAGKKDEAIAVLEATTAKDPGFISGVYQLGMLYNITGKRDRAVELLKRFASLNPSELASGSYGVKDPYGAMGKYYMAILPDGTAAARSAGSVRAAIALWPEPRQMAPDEVIGWPGIAVGDVNGDGNQDLVMTGIGEDAAVWLVVNDGQSGFGMGMKMGTNATSPCLGDVDNDGDLDLWLGGVGGERLFLNDGKGSFAPTSGPWTEGAEGMFTASARLIDIDQDGDLDLVAIRRTGGGLAGLKDAKPAASRVWINGLDGTYTDRAAELGLDRAETALATVVADDLDGDRDLDLLLVSPTGGVIGWENFRVGAFATREGASIGIDATGALGATTGDPFQTGRRDVLVSTGDELILYRHVGTWKYEKDAEFAGRCGSVGGTGAQFVDMDNDGDLDILVGDARKGSKRGPMLLVNEWPERRFAPVGVESVLTGLDGDGPGIAVGGDLDGNGTPDVVWMAGGQRPSVVVNRSPARHWLGLDLEGKRPQDKQGRSPESAIGARAEVRAGAVSQAHVVGSPAGATAMPPLRLHFGLGDNASVPWLRVLWPDSVLQAELEQKADRVLRLSELNRRPASCPHLFAWNGERFAFVSDFGGVGGLGYLMAPGQYAPPDPTEVVRLPGLSPTKDGAYEVRIVEPLEEVVYLDEVTLLAVDHPAGTTVWPHEYAPVGAPPPPGELFCFERLIEPVAATDHRNLDVLDALRRVDRVYAGATEPDRRFLGYAAPHAVTVDFGESLTALKPDDRWILVLDGWVEYSTSTSNYAASQAGLRLEAPSVQVERDGKWVELFHEAGYPAGINHAMTLDLTGKLQPGDRRFRVVSTMDVSWDQIALARDRGGVAVRRVSPSSAELHVLGYPREYSPDGKRPNLLDYSNVDRSQTWLSLPGSYTRYGDVTELVRTTDDRYVVMPSGDEVAVRFDGSSLPPVASGMERSYLLHTDTYCKDTDLYTGSGEGVEPWPFHGMSTYPYDASEGADAARGKAVGEGMREWNTRRVGR
jgi:tetratricopeptide (TPR) repeat protein